jgi:hypothetical protein
MLFLLRVLAVAAAALLAQQARSQSVLYENLSTFNGNFNFTQIADTMAGNEVILPGSSSTYEIAQAEVQVDLINSGISPLAGSPAGTEQGELMFCLNDGTSYNGNATPGRVLWSSGFASLSALGLTNFTQGVTLTYFPGVLVPRDFTWVMVFGNIPDGESAGLSLYSNPIVGTNYHYAWADTGSGWAALEFTAAQNFPLEFGAEIQGMPYPQPGAFQSITVQSNGAVQFGLTGTTAFSYTLDASTNLLTWTPLATFTNLTGPMQYTDFSASNSPARFYRLTATAPIAAPSSYAPMLGPAFLPPPATVTNYTPAQAAFVPPSVGFPQP